jgi:hypothetical protein
VAVIVQMLVLQWALERKAVELRFGALWGSVIKIAVAMIVMSAAVAGGWRWLQQLSLRRDALAHAHRRTRRVRAVARQVSQPAPLNRRLQARQTRTGERVFRPAQ